MHVTRELRYIDPIAAGTLGGAFYALTGLLFGMLFALFAVGAQASSSFLLALLMPLLYGIMGVIVGVLGALLYNLIASGIGGIRVSLRAVR